MIVYGVIRTFGVVALLASASVQYSKIHERLTDDEIANIFHTTRDKLPEYDVVSVRHNRYKRSNHSLRLQFSAFGKEIDAYLHPSDGQLMGANTPVWLAFTKPNGTVEYKKMREGIVGILVSSFFTSSSDFSTVVVNQAKGENPSFNGVVSGLIVRPLPKRFQEVTRSRRNSEALNSSRTMLDTHYHVFINSTSVTEEEKIKKLERQIREASRSSNRNDAFREKRSKQEIIFPSLLVQTDFKGSKTSQDDLDYYEEIIYQLAFWNAVDLRFRHVNDPKIRLRLVGIVIGLDRYATPYLQNHRSKEVVVMDENRVWHEMQRYWYRMMQHQDFPQEAYDIVVTMTDTHMIHNGELINGSNHGMADRNACYLIWEEKIYALAIAYDNGGFEGILTATHELGHVFRLDHDPESGDECGVSNGFIMQPTTAVGPKNLEWSPCSLRSLSYFLRLTSMTCYDKPAEFHPPGDPIQRILPGDVWGPHKQCQGLGYAWACEASPDMCTQMQCYYTHWDAFWNGFWCQNAGPAAEGTLCAPGRKCIDGVCQCMNVDCIYTTNGHAES